MRRRMRPPSSILPMGKGSLLARCMRVWQPSFMLGWR